MTEKKKESEAQEERGFTITDRRHSAKEEPEEAPKAEPAEAPQPPRAEAPPEEDVPLTELPPADFQYLVLFLATQALLCLGEQPDPMTGEKVENLPGAKHAIDLLSVIQDKTTGNLTDSEHQLLESMLYDLRMRYVQVTGAPSP